MDYSQFLGMREELSLLAVILLTFLIDLFVSSEKKAENCGNECSLEGRPCARMMWLTRVPIVLMLVHTVFNLLPCGAANEATWTSLFGGMYLHTEMMTLIKSVLNVGALIVMVMATPYLMRKENHIKAGEFHSLLLFTLLGMYFMISAGHFLMFFIGLELASIPMAALISFNKGCQKSGEAGAKFILLALFSSGLMLYGISLLYGACGTLYFDQMAAALSAPNLISILGLVLVISGLGFKISMVPFHLWTADTYEGARTPVTAFLSVLSQGAAAFTLMVILTKVFSVGPFVEYWDTALQLLIVLSITVANLFAIRQNNLKRFMAFSAISQAGYLVLGILGGTAEGMEALVFYLAVYTFANLGAFAIIHEVEHHSGKVGISDYNGLYTTNPYMAFCMTICLFSLAGIPPFAGFFSKFFIFMAAFKAGFEVTVFIALVNTVISLYYYLLIVKAMYINKNEQPIARFNANISSTVAIVLCVILTMFFGVFSAPFNFLSYFGFGI